MTDPWFPPDPWEPDDPCWEPEADGDPEERAFAPDWEPPYPPPSEYHLYQRDLDDGDDEIGLGDH